MSDLLTKEAEDLAQQLTEARKQIQQLRDDVSDFPRLRAERDAAREELAKLESLASETVNLALKLERKACAKAAADEVMDEDSWPDWTPRATHAERAMQMRVIAENVEAVLLARGDA